MNSEVLARSHGQLGIFSMFLAWRKRRRERKGLIRHIACLEWRITRDEPKCQQWVSIPTHVGGSILLAGWNEKDGETHYYLKLAVNEDKLVSCTCYRWGSSGDLLAARLVNKVGSIAAAANTK